MHIPVYSALPVDQTCLVVGGSSGLGRALAERFAAGGYSIALLSSDRRDLDALATDLALRFGVNTVVLQADLRDARVDLDELDRLLATLPPLSAVLAPAGMNSDDDSAGVEGPTRQALMTANFSSIVDIVAHCIPRLQIVPAAVVVGFGSVAAVRGRSRNAAYGAAKRALQAYFESLRHALARSPVQVQFYVLGYLDTNLAFGKTVTFSRASPVRLAEYIYRHRIADPGVKYYPAIWRPICLIVRLLPWFLFRRLQF